MTDVSVESLSGREVGRGVRPLRIGIMLRGIEEIDGPGVYIRNLCEALIELDDWNEYVLFYSNASQAGRFKNCSNVTERVVWAPGKLLWDQVAIPIVAWREKLDVLFHHKFTISLVSPCPTVVQQRGVEYWTFPQWYDSLDRIYATTAIPIYCNRANRVLTISDTLADDLMPFIGVPREEIETVYAAPDPRFRKITDDQVLKKVQIRYSLPATPFFLMVTKGYSAVSSNKSRTYPRKNVHGVLAAYQTVQERFETPPPLVVAGPGFDGKTISRYKDRLQDPSLLHFPGFVDFSDMPALYSLAHSLIFPSYSESFGIPLVEAMASGCPVVASNTAACPEIVADAGILVDPRNPDEIAEAMYGLVNNGDLYERLIRRGFDRASDFSWEASAEKLLRVLYSVADTDRFG